MATAVSTPVYMASHDTVLFTTAGIQEYGGDFIKGSRVCLYMVIHQTSRTLRLSIVA